jgi:hypothetical protein
MLGELVKAVLERALESELTTHLGYGKHDPAGNGSGNSRNGPPRRERREQSPGTSMAVAPNIRISAPGPTIAKQPPAAPTAVPAQECRSGCGYCHRPGAGDRSAWMRFSVRRPIRLMAGLLSA